ncbi:hypothetical protein AURDEDRAFT_96546 [Auricularia subglabra TFB-10046 SS5]|nr:hypothetical protein AURDEDRAFT_96546 [Auricularia subglabra TFB-10046 SS5]
MSASFLRRGFMKHWFAVEATPIYVIVVGALGGAGWYLGRLALRPEVVWTKNNPTPWAQVQQDQTTKLYHGHHRFDKSWSREKL